MDEQEGSQVVANAVTSLSKALMVPAEECRAFLSGQVTSSSNTETDTESDAVSPKQLLS